MPEKHLQRNIYLLYLIRFSRWFLLTMPIIVPFYTDNGLDLEAVMTLRAINSVVIILMEIPSGYVGDLLGRKRSLLLGTTLGFGGFLAYTQAFAFPEFIIAEILLGLGASFISGSDTALMYDSLVSLEKSDKFVKYEGRVYAIGNFSEASAGIIGGLLAVISLRMPFYFQAGVASLGIVAALFLTEPGRHISLAAKHGFRDVLNAVHYCLVQNKMLRWYILLSGSIGTATLTMAWFAQPYFAYSDFPLAWYGVLWTALNLIVGLASWFAHKFRDRMRTRTLLIFIMVTVIGGYFGTALAPAGIGLVFILLLYAGRGIAVPVLKDMVNMHTPSEMRATILSVRSFIIRMIFAVLAPLLGWMTDTMSLPTAFLLGGGFFLVLNVITLIGLSRTSKASS